MKVFLLLLIIFFGSTVNLFASNDKATCFLGKCEFLFGIWYTHAKTLCMDNLFMEEVDQGPLGFTIKNNGKFCLVYNER